MTPALKIAVAEDEADTREFLQELLARLGHQVVAARNGRQLADLSRLVDPDLIITDIRMAELDGLEAATEVNRRRPTPVIVVSAHHSPELLARAGADHVMAYLVKPVKQADLEAAIPLALKRFDDLRRLSQEAANLRQALDDRKVIERAKGVVMRRVAVEEHEAFRRLRQLASDQNRKLVEVSRAILEAEEVFQKLAKS
jgi:two-component system, response regulator PdtaR